MTEIYRPGRWWWDSDSPPGKFADEFVKALRKASKSEDDFLAFYRSFLVSHQRTEETRASLARLVVAFYARTQIASEDQQEHKQFQKNIDLAEREVAQQTQAAGLRSGKARAKKHDAWITAAQVWLEEHKDPRSVAGAMAKKFGKTEGHMRLVLQKHSVISRRKKRG